MTTQARRRRESEALARRRRLRLMLRITATLCEQTADRLGETATPEQARAAAFDVAADLARVVAELYRAAGRPVAHVNGYRRPGPQARDA
jgi:hypothetical protein